MNNKIFKGYNRLTALFWTVIGIVFFTSMIAKLPLWAAITFTLSCLIPYYTACSYLTNFMQPRAIRENKMAFFIFEFLIATCAMTLIYVSTRYLFSMLEANGYFPNSILFDDLESSIDDWLEALPVAVLLNLAFCGLRFYYEHTKLHKMHLESQLQVLQSQVNPHYMFNVLNHLHILMRKDIDKATFLLEKYSEILRYQLYYSSKESVPLSQEVNFIKDVISIEKIRWGDEVQVEEEWDVADSWKNIHPLILIPFIENAFKHVSRSISEKGYVKLALKQRNNVVCLNVENSKWENQAESVASSKSKVHKSGLGISNVKERLEILYPNRHTLSIDETAWIYKIELTITL